MNITVTTPPTSAPVDMNDAYSFLGLEPGEFAAIVGVLVRAAATSVENDTGRTLTATGYRLDLDAFPACGGALELPRPPTIQVTAVRYVDPAGSTQTISPSAYRVTGLGSLGFARITPALGTGWPTTARVPAAVTVEITGGFGTDEMMVPDDLRAAVLARVATGFAIRESAVIAAGAIRENPETAAAIDRWRVNYW